MILIEPTLPKTVPESAAAPIRAAIDQHGGDVITYVVHPGSQLWSVYILALKQPHGAADKHQQLLHALKSVVERYHPDAKVMLTVTAFAHTTSTLSSDIFKRTRTPRQKPS